MRGRAGTPGLAGVRLHKNDTKGPRAVYALDPLKLDIDGRAAAADPGEGPPALHRGTKPGDRLRDVADDIGMHESTVSRVTTNKYVHAQVITASTASSSSARSGGSSWTVSRPSGTHDGSSPGGTTTVRASPRQVATAAATPSGVVRTTVAL